jgi:hypothetical protein
VLLITCSYEKFEVRRAFTTHAFVHRIVLAIGTFGDLAKIASY